MRNISIARWLAQAGVVTGVLVIAGGLLFAGPAAAVTNQSGAVGVQATIPGAPPTRGATIVVPSNGAVFTSVPITVSGLCPSGLLVKVFDNNVFAGSVVCSNGSYSLQIDLFNGQNDLLARVYDALDQTGPDTNTVTVTFNDAQFIQFGTAISLSSVYAERGAPPGTELDWPVLLSGGTGPYAISVDWGDSSPSDLLSVIDAGTINLKHTYKVSGIYKVIVKATDKNGESAFLQLVGQGTGAIQNNNTKGGGTTIIQHDVTWWPLASMLPLIFSAFWIGRLHGMQALRKKLHTL